MTTYPRVYCVTMLSGSFVGEGGLSWGEGSIFPVELALSGDGSPPPRVVMKDGHQNKQQPASQL